MKLGSRHFSGARPARGPVDRGCWEPETVYLTGDTVTDDEGSRWEAVADYRSGFLPPALVVEDIADPPWVPA